MVVGFHSSLWVAVILGTTGTAAAQEPDWTPPWTELESQGGSTGDGSANAELTVPSLPDGCPKPVLITRASSAEAELLQLTTCLGQPSRAVLDEVSLLARPHGVPIPTLEERQDGDYVSADIRRLDIGLLARLQQIADHWPDQAIVIVSGYRPSPTSRSRHAHAQALDIQVTGTTRWELASFARSLADTGVGYYPNSVFTHIDVRDGSVAWMDLSAPGERANYAPWPDEPVSSRPPAATFEEVRRSVREAIDLARQELQQTRLELK